MEISIVRLGGNVLIIRFQPHDCESILQIINCATGNFGAVPPPPGGRGCVGGAEEFFPTRT